MSRLSTVISGWLLTTSALLVLCAGASAATPSGAVHAPCRLPGARTLAADRTVRVSSWHGSAYGCLDATGVQQKLGGTSFCNLPRGLVAPVKVAGDLVAYGLESCGVDTGSSVIVVRDLRTAKRLADVPAASLPLGAESYVTVASLVLRSDGATGWITREASLASHQPVDYEVHRLAAGRNSLLDANPAIVPASLRLAGSHMTWRDGAATHSANLP